MPAAQASLTSQVSISPHVSFHNLDGEAVMLNLESGKYYGLDEVGTRMWTLIAEHGVLEPVKQALLAEYNVSEEQLQGDLLKLVESLAEHGLILIDNEAQASE